MAPDPHAETPLGVLGSIATSLREVAKSLRGINLRHTITTVVTVAFTVTNIWLLVVVLNQSHSNGEAVAASHRTLSLIEDCLSPHGRCARLRQQTSADDRRRFFTGICSLFSTDPKAISVCVHRAVTASERAS